MTTRTCIILAAVILAVALLLGCVDLDIDKRTEWQGDVLERQRHEGQPGNVETVEAAPSVEVAERE